MRALLKPDIARSLGVVLLKPGSELMSLFLQGRILIEPEPKSMSHLPSGRVPDARQPLAEDKSLESFFTDERVIKAAGGMPALEAWLRRRYQHCQWPHSDYHHAELVTMPYLPGAILLCWHCDNELRDQSTERLSALARKNVVEWVVDSILMSLRAGKDRELSIAELCWWAVYAGVADAIPEGLAARALRLPYEPFPTVYKESNIIAVDNRPTIALQGKIKAAEALKRCRPEANQQETQEQHPKVLALRADPESPESFMLRPKRRRWTCEDYTRWVKAQPCSGCRRPADDPHHIIGNGMGGTATKAHDLFVFPLCRECHDELHADVAAFEKKHGSQLQLLFRFLDWALAVGVIVNK